MQPHDVVNDLVKDFEKLSGRYSLISLFDDFCCMAMASFHNSLYTVGKMDAPAHYKDTVDRLEKNYEEIVKKHDKQTLDKFAFMLAKLISAMHEKPYDYLGSVYMRLGIGNGSAGQFFTPSHICDLMASITLDKATIEQHIKERKPITMHDPTCGSGAMAIGFINALKNDYNLENYANWVHITLIDLDYLCVKMAYIQMAILGVVASILHGDTLTLKIESRFDTPSLQLALREPGTEPHNLPPDKTGQLSLF